MNADRTSSGRPNDRDLAEAPAVRKPYQKPAFQREQVFETMALACGKVNPTSGGCLSVRKTS